MSSAGSTILIEYQDSVPTDHWTDITGSCLLADTHFSMSANAVPGTAAVKVKDPDQVHSFKTGHGLRLTVDGTLLWSGYVMQVDYEHAFPADDTNEPDAYRNRMFTLHCVDQNIIFDKRVINWSGNYVTKVPPTGLLWSTYDGDILKDMLANYVDGLSGFDISSQIENIRHGPDPATVADAPTLYYHRTQGTKIREEFNLYAGMTAAVFYISATKAFHYHALESVLKRWAFSDVPMLGPVVLSGDPNPLGTNATYPFREVTATEDATMLANDALVWGGASLTSGGTVVFSRTMDESSHHTTTANTEVDDGSIVPGSSIDLRGRWQLAEDYTGKQDQDHGTLDGVKARSDAIVWGNSGTTGFGSINGYGSPQWHFRFGWFAHDVPYVSGSRNHVVCGDLMTIEMQSFFGTGNAQILPCRSLEVSFVGADNEGDAFVRFDGDFGLMLDDLVTLWSFLRQRTLVINTAPATTVPAGGGGTVYGAYGQTVPTPTPDGVNTVFYIPYGYISGQLNVMIDGLAQKPGTDFIESDNVHGEFTMTTPPYAGEHLYCTFRTLAS